jgi:uncharacterized protein (TIGR02001 family)
MDLSSTAASTLAAPLQACVAAATLGVGAPVFGADGHGGSLAVLSDSVYRGISQTQGAPAVQAGLYREVAAGWSVGGTFSTVDLGTWIDATYELSGSLTRAWPIGETWSAKASYVYYLYPQEKGEYDYEEWHGSLTYRHRLTATVGYSPNASIYSHGYTVGKQSAMSYELSGLHPLGPHWSATAGLGYYDLHDAVSEGYRFWSAGLLFSWDSIQLDLLRIDTDSTALQLFGPERAGGRWSAAVMWKF